MAGQIKINFKNFTYIDFSSAKKRTPIAYKPPGFGEETLIRAGLSGLSAVAPASVSSRITSLVSLITPPASAMTILGSIPGLKILTPSPDYTVAVGLTASAAAGVAAGAGGGLYMWKKATGMEVGLYGSVSVGVVTNLGVGIGDQVTFLFGSAPSLLKGDSITLSVDVEIGPLTVGGQLILSAPPVSLWPPAMTGTWTPEVWGVGIALTAGVSVIPLNVSVMPSRTWTKPLGSI